MTELAATAALFLAAASLGLRIVSLLIGERSNAYLRLVIALVIGNAIVVYALRLCDSYQVHDLGLGLLVSLSPVGVYDLIKWWLRRHRRQALP
jgi:hypothetical protein